MASPTQFKLRRLDTRVGPIAVLTMDNGEDWTKPNTFGEAALRSLETALGELESGDCARARPHREAVRVRGRR